MAWDKNLIAEGVLAPDLNDEIRSNWAALEDALNKEMNFATGGTASLQGILKQGGARCFWQATAPATRADGSAFASTDLGLLWIDSDNNKIYILTATTPTWTSIESVTIATLLAASRVFAEIITFTKAPVIGKPPSFTEGVCGASSYLVGRNEGDDGNVDLIRAARNEADDADVSQIPDAARLASNTAPTEDTQLVNKKYQDDHVGHDGDGYVLRDIDGTPTKVYTKYLTGTLVAGTSTSVAHGVTASKILAVSVICYDGDSSYYRASEAHLGADTTAGFSVYYDATNVVIQSVGSRLRGHAYRIKIDYYA